MVRFPKVLIVLQSAGTSKTPGCEVLVTPLVEGKMLTSASVSIRNRLPEILSCTKSKHSLVLDAMAATDALPACFPSIHKVVGICNPFYQTCDGNNEGWRVLKAVSFWALVVTVVAAGHY